MIHFKTDSPVYIIDEQTYDENEKRLEIANYNAKQITKEAYKLYENYLNTHVHKVKDINLTINGDVFRFDLDADWKVDANEDISDMCSSVSCYLMDECEKSLTNIVQSHIYNAVKKIIDDNVAEPRNIIKKYNKKIIWQNGLFKKLVAISFIINVILGALLIF